MRLKLFLGLRAEESEGVERVDGAQMRLKPDKNVTRIIGIIGRKGRWDSDEIETRRIAINLETEQEIGVERVDGTQMRLKLVGLPSIWRPSKR